MSNAKLNNLCVLMWRGYEWNDVREIMGLTDDELRSAIRALGARQALEVQRAKTYG